MSVALHAADEARKVLPAHHQVAGQVADAHAALRLLARQGAQDRPLLRRQPFFLHCSAARFMQHICALVEAKEQPVGKIHLRFGRLGFGVYHYISHRKKSLEFENCLIYI